MPPWTCISSITIYMYIYWIKIILLWFNMVIFSFMVTIFNIRPKSCLKGLKGIFLTKQKINWIQLHHTLQKLCIFYFNHYFFRKQFLSACHTCTISKKQNLESSWSKYPPSWKPDSANSWKKLIQYCMPWRRTIPHKHSILWFCVLLPYKKLRLPAYSSLWFLRRIFCIVSTWTFSVPKSARNLRGYVLCFLILYM